MRADEFYVRVEVVPRRRVPAMAQLVGFSLALFLFGYCVAMTGDNMLTALRLTEEADPYRGSFGVFMAALVFYGYCAIQALKGWTRAWNDLL